MRRTQKTRIAALVLATAALVPSVASAPLPASAATGAVPVSACGNTMPQEPNPVALSLGARDTLTLVEADLEKRFGVNSKTIPDQQLRAGLIGAAWDAVSKQVVVVVDARVDSTAVALGLDRAVAVTRSAAASAPIDVRKSCRSAAGLLEAGRIIGQRQWHSGARVASFAWHLDPLAMVHRISFSEQSRPAAEALKRQLGDRVSITWGGAQRTDRADDGQPHWGGAGVGVVGDPRGNTCSSGFTVDTTNAGKAMVTAGHCFSNGQRIESGDEAYGTAQLESNFPAFDMMLINASNQNYDDDIYHNPLRPEQSPLDVSGSANASSGASLCISGMIHLSVCGNVVNHQNAALCDESGCTYGLVQTVREGAEPCQGGTSGGAMYRNSSPTIVHGLLIGANLSASNGRPVSCLGEKITSVTSHLNVRVATSP